MVGTVWSGVKLIWPLWKHWRAGREVWPKRCIRCGYDHTGISAEQCPECGVERVAQLPEPWWSVAIEALPAIFIWMTIVMLLVLVVGGAVVMVIRS